MKYNEHIEVGDSLQHSPSTENIGNLPDDVFGATLVSFVVLIVAYFIKYVSLGVSLKNLWEATKELPVDTNTIVITVLVSFYYKVHTVNNLIALIIGLILCVFICGVIRSIIAKISARDDFNLWWGILNALLLLTEYAIPTTSTFFIVNNYL